MRVGVNLCWLVPGVVGGSEEATTRALHALADSQPPDVEIVLFGSSSLREAHPDLVTRFETHTMPLPGGVKPWRVLAEHTWLPLSVRRHHIDVLHDAGGTSPGRVGVPRVLTVHDIQPLELPRNFGRIKVLYLRWAVPRAVASATRVMVPSAFVRDRLVDRLGTDAGRVDIVPWSVPPMEEGTPIASVRARYGIIGRIVLVAGITYPHKDHAVAVQAMRHLVDRHGETTLVLAGGEGPAEAQVAAEIERQGIADRVVRTGRVPAAVVASLFRHAVVVVVPSRYEGFGIPALEAMAVGTPVVVADAGSLPEVVGDAGVVVPAGDDAQLAVELHRILSDADHARALSDAGRDRARTFSPERTADAMLAAYRSASTDL
ncbi:MAG: glycosyltransferase family 4 protein [Acidimicrobiales bacterium]